MSGGRSFMEARERHHLRVLKFEILKSEIDLVKLMKLFCTCCVLNNEIYVFHERQLFERQ